MVKEGGFAPFLGKLKPSMGLSFLWRGTKFYPQFGGEQYRKTFYRYYRMGYRLCAEPGTVYAQWWGTVYAWITS
jgi:hypothetical protein